MENCTAPSRKPGDKAYLFIFDANNCSLSGSPIFEFLLPLETDKKPSPKILHILARALRGGVEKNCYHLIRASPQFEHEIAILDNEGPMLEEFRAIGATTSVLGLLGKGRSTFFRELRRRLPENGFQKIIVWTNVRMPVVVHALNKYQADVYVHIGNPVRMGWSEWLQSLFLPATNRVHLRPVSAYVQRSLKQNPYYRGFASRVSLKPIVISDVAAKDPVAVAGTSVVQLGMVARLDPIKDHETVIRAFQGLLRDYPAALLNLVGDGSMIGALRKLVAEHRLDSRVIFHGDVPDVYSRMKDWDLFLYATTVREGLGGTIPEALSIGLPVVATDLPMIREWDPGGRFISFCEPGDSEAMAQAAKLLLEDVLRRKEISQEAPRYIQERFSPEIFSYNYISDE